MNDEADRLEWHAKNLRHLADETTELMARLLMEDIIEEAEKRFNAARLSEEQRSFRQAANDRFSHYDHLGRLQPP